MEGLTVHDPIEAAARAMWPLIGNDYTFDEAAAIKDDAGFAWVIDLAQAAIAAARPLIMAEAAGIAEAHIFGPVRDERDSARNATAQCIAIAIRTAGATEPADQWQPIETAPRDGTRILLAHPADRITEKYHRQVGEGLWHYTEEWRWANDSCDCCYGAMLEGEPTHWQPLPAPPRHAATPADPHEEQGR